MSSVFLCIFPRYLEMIGNWFFYVKRFLTRFLKIEVEKMLIWILDGWFLGRIIVLEWKSGICRRWTLIFRHFPEFGIDETALRNNSFSSIGTITRHNPDFRIAPNRHRQIEHRQSYSEFQVEQADNGIIELSPCWAGNFFANLPELKIRKTGNTVTDFLRPIQTRR